MSSFLLPYIPRLTIDWQRDDPAAAYREIDGSLLFADISGFTAMSERLARKGREGAEEVTDILDTNFAHLLEAAYQEGGSLLKFGGDALLLLFTEQDHTVRACRAAVEMRQRLRTGGRIRTSAGIVRLRMSAGVHSGPLQFFLCGESHRELIVAGPGATATVLMEATANAGQIAVSGTSADRLPPGCTTPASSDAYLLTRTPPGPVAARPASAPVSASFDVGAYVPVGLRRQLQSSERESEHRQVTVAFLHFAGIDGIIGRKGLSEAGDVLDGLVRSVQAAAEQHEVCFLGSDIDRDGGKVILTAGAPIASEDDEERMLRTVRAVSDGAYGRMISIGVNRGHVFAGDVGPPYRRTYTVMGDAVNLAARLMARAQGGEILVSPSVLERATSEFELEELEPFAVKGKAKPVRAMRLGALPARSANRPRARQAPFVGRGREMDRLLAAIDEARQHGQSKLVVLTGEAGVGKSRLLQEIAARAPDVRWLRASGQQYEASTAYFPLRRLLRSLLELEDAGAEEAGNRLASVVDRLLPGLKLWLPLLAIPLDVAVAPTPEAEALPSALRRTRLHESVTQLLAALLPDPAVLVFDDVHWFDEASLDLLRYLVRGLPERPWLICVAGRSVPEWLEHDRAAVMHLTQLSSESSFELAAALTADTALPDHELTAIAQRGAGNPLFIEEVAAAWEKGRDEHAPESIESMLVARIDRLPPPERALLRLASVIGSTFTLDELQAAVPDATQTVEISDPLRQFLASDGPDAFRFRHELVREVAYASLPFRRRRELHRAAGLQLEQATEDPGTASEVLSLHFYRAQDYPRAWRYSVTAGDRAKAKFANVEAADFYRRALEASRRTAGIHPRTLADVLESLGDVCELSADYAEALKAYANARRYVSAGLARVVELLHKSGIVRERLGQYPQALRFYSTASRRAAGGDYSLARARIGVAYAGVKFRQGHYAQCISHCLRLLPDIERANDRRLLAHAYYLLDHAYTIAGSDEGERYRNLALPIFQELADLVGQANVLNNLGVTAYFQGKWNEALELYARSRSAREEAGDVVGAATAANNIGEILSDQGKIDEAEDLFRSALRTWRAARYAVGVALATSNLGRAATRCSRFDEAERLLTQARDAFGAIGAKSFVLETEARIAELLLNRDDTRQAGDLIESLLGRVDVVPSNGVLRAMLLRMKAYACSADGRTLAAAEAVRESEREARAASADYELALTLVASSELDREAPQSRVDEGRTILRRLGVLERTVTVREAQAADAC